MSFIHSCPNLGELCLSTNCQRHLSSSISSLFGDERNIQGLTSALITGTKILHLFSFIKVFRGRKMVQGALKKSDNLTRYEIHMAAGELLKITRRNEGLEWAKFTVRDPSSDPSTVPIGGQLWYLSYNNFLCMWLCQNQDSQRRHHGLVVLSEASVDFCFLKISIFDDWISTDYVW